MKRYLLLLGIALATNLPAQVTGDTEISKITVEFPAEPSRENREMETPVGLIKTTGMILRQGNSSWSFMVTAPLKFNKDELNKRYDMGKAGLLKNPARKLILEQSFSVGPYQGRRLVVHEEGRMRVDQRIIIIDDVMHTVMVHCGWNEDIFAVGKSFFESVKLKKE